RGRGPCESEGATGLALHGRQARQRRQRSGYLVLLLRDREAFCEAGPCRRVVAAWEADVAQTEQRPGYAPVHAAQIAPGGQAPLILRPDPRPLHVPVQVRSGSETFQDAGDEPGIAHLPRQGEALFQQRRPPLAVHAQRLVYAFLTTGEQTNRTKRLGDPIPV